MIEGPKALELIQKVTTNDASKLTVGKAQYSCLPNETGGIVDDLIVYRVKDETYLLVVNASNIDKDWAHISKYNEAIGTEMQNISDDYSLLAIQGPKAVEAMQSITSVDLSAIKFYNFVVGDFAGLTMSLFRQRATRVLVVLRFIARIPKYNKYGTKYWKPVPILALNPLVWLHVTHCDWKWVTVFTETILMTPPLLLKLAWVG